MNIFWFQFTENLLKFSQIVWSFGKTSESKYLCLGSDSLCFSNGTFDQKCLIRHRMTLCGNPTSAKNRNNHFPGSPFCPKQFNSRDLFRWAAKRARPTFYSHEPVSVEHEVLSVVLVHVHHFGNKQGAVGVIRVDQDTVARIDLLIADQGRSIVAARALHFDGVTQPIHRGLTDQKER